MGQTGTNAGARSAQSLLLERIWHRSQGKGGPNEAPPHTHPCPNPLSPPADWITAPRFASRTITLTDKTQVGMLVPVVLSGDRHLNSGGIWPPHTHPWPNLLSPPADWITKNAFLQRHGLIQILNKSQIDRLWYHSKTQGPQRFPKA